MEERYRSERALSLGGFFQTVETLWQKCGHSESIMREPDLAHWEQYPCITYHIVGRTWALKERKPRQRQTISDPDNPDRFITLLGQMFDYIIQFDIWAKSHEQADALLDKFEDFLLVYTPYFMQMGVNQLVFERQLEDQVVTSWRDPVVNRRLQYALRLERLTPVVFGELERVLTNVDLDQTKEE